ncbi:MAG: DUF167 domain-containing protein [Candidatus Nanoarchaeia archaeon]
MLEGFEGLLVVKVKANAKKTEILSLNPLKIAVKEAPEGGKANVALVKFLMRSLKKPVKLLRGATSKEKVFKIG